MQVPVYIGGYVYNDKTVYALIWEENRQKKAELIQKKKVIRKWQGNKMVYLEAPRNDNITWFANCNSTLEDFTKAKKTCKNDRLQMFHVHSYELASSQETRFIRRYIDLCG